MAVKKRPSRKKAAAKKAGKSRNPAVSEQRHYNMSRIKSKDTSIEIKLRKALWHAGYRYRKNYKKLPGTPDIVITKYKVAIFCDSEFFHGKDWEVSKARLERGNNADYWIKKILRNMEHDREVDKELRFLGYQVLRFWGEDINKHTDLCVKAVGEAISGVKMDYIYWEPPMGEPMVVEEERLSAHSSE